MFYKISLSPQECAIITYKNDIYELLHVTKQLKT